MHRDHNKPTISNNINIQSILERTRSSKAITLMIGTKIFELFYFKRRNYTFLKELCFLSLVLMPPKRKMKLLVSLDYSNDIQCLMLPSMTSKLQTQHKEMNVQSISFHLCKIFVTHAR